jgi:hypothetical protein
MTETRKCSPSDFIAYLQETYFPTYESPASRYRPYDIITYYENFDSFTIKDFQDYPSTLTEIGIDRNKAFSLYKEKEKGDVFFEDKNRESYKLGISHLSGAMENFPNLSKIRLEDYPRGPSGAELPYHRVRDLARNTRGILLEAAQTSIGRKSTYHPQITHLEIEHWEPAWGRSFRITSALPFFLNLTHFEVTKRKFVWAQYHGYQMDLFLAGLPNLEHLAIHNNVDMDTDLKARFEVRRALTAISSKNLKSVSLECCEYKYPYFENFLRKHVSTLRSLEMNRSFLIIAANNTYTFYDLFTFIREYLQLSKLAIRSFLVEIKSYGVEYADGPEPETSMAAYEDERMAISEYVLGKREQYPPGLLNKQNANNPDLVEVIPSSLYVG